MTCPDCNQCDMEVVILFSSVEKKCPLCVEIRLIKEEISKAIYESLKNTKVSDLNKESIAVRLAGSIESVLVDIIV